PLGDFGDVPALVGALPENERRGHRGIRKEAWRSPADNPAGDQPGFPQDLGPVRSRGGGEKSVLQESLRVAARLRFQGGTRQALHVPALRLAGGPLLAGGERVDSSRAEAVTAASVFPGCGTASARRAAATRRSGGKGAAGLGRSPG